MQTIKDSNAGERLVRALLEGAGFAGFSFSTQFSLRFSRPRPGTHEGKELPAEVELVLHGTWRFGEEDEWHKHVARIAPPNAAEPDEPVQAWELANLRWTDGANVESVAVADGALSIRFQNGHVLTASAALDDGDTAWAVGVAGESESAASWSVASANGELFVRGPHLNE